MGARAFIERDKGHLVAAIAGEGQEIDLPAIVDGAVLSQIWKCRCPHNLSVIGPGKKFNSSEI